MADEVYVDRSVVRYVRQLAEASRVLPHVKMGLSARGCLAFVRAAKTWAAADGRGHVVPHDIATLAEPVLGHRILLDAQAQFGGIQVADVVATLLDRRAAPGRPDRLTAGTRARRGVCSALRRGVTPLGRGVSPSA